MQERNPGTENPDRIGDQPDEDEYDLEQEMFKGDTGRTESELRTADGAFESTSLTE